MPLPWLQILDAVIGVTDLARSRKIRKMSQTTEEQQQQLEAGGRGGGALGNLETRLAGVVVAALKEAFDRDTRRLELERAQLDAERERAERALNLELLRQAGDREIGRLRLLAGVAAATWIGTLFFSARLIGGQIGARVAIGGGWLLLLGAIAMSFVAQSQVAAALDRVGSIADRRDAVTSGVAGALALWLIVLGLALVGLAVLIA
jgi:hypothetical protein